MDAQVAHIADPKKRRAAIHTLHQTHIVQKYGLDGAFLQGRTMHHMGGAGHVQFVDMGLHKIFGGHRGLADWRY